MDAGRLPRGARPEPTYHAFGDHTEGFQVDYVPAVVSYTDLLDSVFRAHDPYSQSRKTQHQHVVSTASPTQEEALKTYLAGAGLNRDAMETRLAELSRFYPAGYDDEALRESPAATKVNGHAAGSDISVASNLGLTDDGAARYR